jgi:hypothetical protein
MNCQYQIGLKIILIAFRVYQGFVAKTFVNDKRIYFGRAYAANP